jgi:hypothetical protein
MQPKYKIRSVLICDDVRQEITGKEILIGLYNDSILFNAFPTIMSQFVVRISLDIFDLSTQKFRMSLIDPKGTTLNNSGAPLNKDMFKDHVTFGFAMQGLTFYLPGKYEIHFALNDDPLEKISDFDVRLPRDDQEKSRVPKPQVATA